MGKTDDLVEFDCPFWVTEDGKVETGPFKGLHAPEVYHDDDTDVEIGDEAWSAWSHGYTGQFGYAGPVMHASEFIGGRLERDLLDDPGVYVVTTVEVLPEDGEDDPEPAGWIILKHEADRPVPDGYVDCECCGIHIIGRWKCDSCEAGACDPDVTWHCSGAFGHDCDGSGCPSTKAEWEADQAR